ncbi:MAG: hypothetical protein M1269_05055 [Chloroflexi bacterium]|nr:hypothetical protein [Chloroflexota bacterium]
MQEEIQLFGSPVTDRMLKKGRAALFTFTLIWGIGFLLFFRIVVSRYELLFTGSKMSLPPSVGLLLNLGIRLAEPVGLLVFLILILAFALVQDMYFKALGHRNPDDAYVNQDLWVLGGAILFPFILFMIQLIMILPYYRVYLPG